MRPPLRRTVKFGTTGLDVEAHTVAMHRYLKDGQLIAFRNQPRTMRQTFGIAKRTLAKKCAAKAGLPQYGVIGPGLYSEMWESSAYDTTATKQLLDFSAQVDALHPRQRVVEYANQYLVHAREIHYSQSRPIVTISRDIRLPNIPPYLDCSGFVISCYWMANVADELGSENAHGSGNTWSLAGKGKSVRVPDLRPADLVFYGNCSHVAVYVGGGQVVTNGHYPMSRSKLTYRGDYWGARSYLA